MSKEVFSQKESVYFVVTGVGTDQGYAGGCTLDYINNNGGFADFDLLKIMNADGSPICYSNDADYVNATGVITEGTPGEFDDAEVGMIIYTSDLEDDGRYEITAVGAGTITIESGLDSGDLEINIYIGGAFETIDEALDVITASDTDGAHDCYLFTNKDGEEFGIGGGGNIANNTKLFIIGFNTTLLDMMQGGAYYQTAVDAWYLGIDSDCRVKFDFLDTNTFESAGEENVMLYNFHFKDGSNKTVYVEDGSSGIMFFNCIVEGSVRTVELEGDSRGICFIDCYVFDGSTNLLRTYGAITNIFFIDCVLDQVENDKIMLFGGVADTTVIASGCLIVNGSNLFLGPSDVVEWNNTIIGHASNTDSIHRLNDPNSLRISFNDIYVIRDAAHVVDIAGAGGSVLTEKNCLWGNSGAYGGDFAINIKVGGQPGIRGLNTIEADPEFDNDYRPRNPQILRGGTDGRSQLGAYKQKYHFPQKARIVNHGRVGILK